MNATTLKTTMVPTMPSAASLLTRARAGDGDAFGELVDRHKDALVNYLTRLTGCRDRAEDFAQETFVRFYRNLDRYREDGNLAAYLYRIATNQVRSDERRRRRWQMLEPLFRLHVSNTGPSPGAETLAAEERRQVAQALANIDLRMRAPLVLREIEGWTYQEIAEALETSVGTVKSRLHRGRQLLKEKLAGYWQGER